MAASVYDIQVEQGATFHFVVTFRNPDGSPADLTGYRAIMQVRSRPGSAVLIELHDGAGITLFDDGRIDVEILGVETQKLRRNAVYDIVLFPRNRPADTVRAYEGSVVVRRGVTIRGA